LVVTTATESMATGVQLMVALRGLGVTFRGIGRIRFELDTLEAESMNGQWDSCDKSLQMLSGQKGRA